MLFSRRASGGYYLILISRLTLFMHSIWTHLFRQFPLIVRLSYYCLSVDFISLVLFPRRSNAQIPRHFRLPPHRHSILVGRIASDTLRSFGCPIITSGTALLTLTPSHSLSPPLIYPHTPCHPLLLPHTALAHLCSWPHKFVVPCLLFPCAQTDDALVSSEWLPRPGRFTTSLGSLDYRNIYGRMHRCKMCLVEPQEVSQGWLTIRD